MPYMTGLSAQQQKASAPLSVLVKIGVVALSVWMISGCTIPPETHRTAPAAPPPARTQPPVSTASGSVSDATTLIDKTIVGYQGWFSCPDDTTGERNWGHWMNSDRTAAVDMIPDTSELPQQPGCRAPFLKDASGAPVMLYSAQNPETVDVHFGWLQKYDISGAALQRYVSELSNPVMKQARDVVLANVQKSAERHGRVFFITYDISGAGADWAEVIKRDWQALVTAHVTDSSAYLHHGGRPVVEIWGIGFNDRPAKPTEAMDLMRFFTANSDSRLRASVVAGVPVGWHEQTQRENNAPSWMDVFKLASAVSPWFIGSFKDSASEQRVINRFIRDDVAITRQNNQVYMPIIFPGFSSANQTHGKVPFNVNPRECGRFLTMQTDALLQLGVNSFYVAMFDEANEGTAVYKARLDTVVPSQGTAQFLGAEPGCPNQSTLYLQMLGSLTRRLNSR